MYMQAQGIGVRWAVSRAYISASANGSPLLPTKNKHSDANAKRKKENKAVKSIFLYVGKFCINTSESADILAILYNKFPRKI